MAVTTDVIRSAMPSEPSVGATCRCQATPSELVQATGSGPERPTATTRPSAPVATAQPSVVRGVYRADEEFSKVEDEREYKRAWNDAMVLPGSRQAGLAKRVFEQFPWQRYEPHPEWASFAVPPDAQARAPVWGDWIWFPEGNPAKHAPSETRYFRCTFEIPAGKAIVRAVLRLSADDRLTAHLNGRQLGSHNDWPSGREFRGIQRQLKPGKNVLAVAAARWSAGWRANRRSPRTRSSRSRGNSDWERK